jgi:hypothetical protein
MYVDKTYENPTACCRFPCLCCTGLMSLECLWPSLDLFYFSHRIKERSFQRFSSFVLVEFYASPPSVFRLSFQNIFASFGGSWNKAKVEILLHNSLSLLPYTKGPLLFSLLVSYLILFFKSFFTWFVHLKKLKLIQYIFIL